MRGEGPGLGVTLGSDPIPAASSMCTSTRGLTESHSTGHYESIHHRGEDTVHSRRQVGGDALTWYPHPSPPASPGFNYRVGIWQRLSLKTELKTKTTLPPHLVCTSEAALWSVQDKVTGDHGVHSRSPIKPFSLAPLEGGQCPPPAYQGGHCLSILGTAKKTQLMPPAPRSQHGDQPLAGAPAPPMTPHEVSWALELLRTQPWYRVMTTGTHQRVGRTTKPETTS